MSIPLRVLFIEDSDDDTAMVVRELKQAGYDVSHERVDTPAAMNAALDRQKWDLIISDHSMPHFSGVDALKLLRQKEFEVPFIFISGTLGEEAAVAALKDGAQDYVMKSNLTRLIPAVERVVREAEQRCERKRLEQHVHELQKFEAIGRLAGGVAHDFNNLLGVILGQSEILLDRIHDEAVVHGLQMINESAERGAALTRQLLAFSRRQVLEPRVLNLNVILGDVEKLLRRVIGENIELEFQADTKLGSVEADPGQLEQVIVNLAINARDAMPTGGKLTITTANVKLDESYVDRRVVVQPGSYVQLGVTDTGCGMDEQTQSRIFEPFFTTKEVGKGTGLGLATVYGIVKQSGGYIWVYSEPGHGTAFRICLPRVEALAEGPERVQPREEPLPGTGTILIVEDDASLREVTCEFLKNSGYTVLEAGSPDEALRAVERHGGPIDLLLTDVIMPKMNGRALAARLAAVRPGMKILYVSGYTDGIVWDDPQRVLEPGLAFLQKPYTRYALTRKVRDVLERPVTQDGPNSVP
jgi:two-component system, cell cycle sensor histidine kinase and response regulator CckA